MGQFWSTSVVAPRLQFEFWRDAICDVFVQREAERDCNGGAFDGRIQVEALADLTISDLTSEQQLVTRSRRQIARAREEIMLVSLQLEGEGLIEQDGRAAHLRPGDFALYDSTRPYRLRFDKQFRQLVLHMLRHCLTGRLAAPREATASRIAGDSPIGTITSHYLCTLAERAGALEPATALQLCERTFDLLALAANDGAPRTPQGRAAVRAALLQRLKTFVEINLADPALSPEKIARAQGISLRHLYALFAETDTTVGDWIRLRRLSRCDAALADPRQQHRSITEIALAWGFNDSAHFSRCYRQRYGRTPSDRRAAALALP